MRVRKYRGLGLKFYLFTAAFGVVSTFYIFRPIIDQLEKRNASAQRDAALSAIEATKNHLVMFRPLNHGMYHNAGKPRRLLRDDGSEYGTKSNLTPKQGHYRSQLFRLEHLEKQQLDSGRSRPKVHRRFWRSSGS